MSKTQSTDQAGADQLDKLAKEFELWRNQKQSLSERIPQTLLREAQKLSQHYKASAVRQKLGISKKQLDKLEALDRTPVDSSDFLAVYTEQPTPQLHELTIEITTPQGVKMTLSGFAEQHPLPFIAKLIEG